MNIFYQFAFLLYSRFRGNRSTRKSKQRPFLASPRHFLGRLATYPLTPFHSLIARALIWFRGLLGVLLIRIIMKKFIFEAVAATTSPKFSLKFMAHGGGGRAKPSPC